MRYRWNRGAHRCCGKGRRHGGGLLLVVLLQVEEARAYAVLGAVWDARARSSEGGVWERKKRRCVRGERRVEVGGGFDDGSTAGREGQRGARGLIRERGQKRVVTGECADEESNGEG